MYYIVGLGNPGDTYEGTRHNVGWFVLDTFVSAVMLPTPMPSAKYSGRYASGIVEGVEVSVLYPDTFMNNSGAAVEKLVPKSVVSQLIVVYDDIDLPVGDIKISAGRGDGGHNGVKSIIERMGSKDFVRVRVGIAPKSMWTGKMYRPTGDRMARHVLGRFSRSEQEVINEAAQRAASALRCLITHGPETAMNTYN